MKLCLATNNKHKVYELRQLLKSFELISLEEIGCFEDIPETKDTIAGNALQKAEYVWEKYNVACIADDSGLEIEALDGKPGVLSARYAGPERSDTANMQRILDELEGIQNRRARFVCVLTFIDSSGFYQFEGYVEGHIIDYPKGSNGFGYDPVFVPNGYSDTFAELSDETKNQISHRAIATKKMVDFLEKKFKN